MPKITERDYQRIALRQCRDTITDPDMLTRRYHAEKFDGTECHPNSAWAERWDFYGAIVHACGVTGIHPPRPVADLVYANVPAGYLAGSGTPEPMAAAFRNVTRHATVAEMAAIIDATLGDL